MTEITNLCTLETSNGTLENVSCAFDIEVQTYPAEPTSWGSSQGTETEVEASLSYIELGALMLLPEEAMNWLGADCVIRLEREAAEGYVVQEPDLQS